ncbi:MAG: type I DNA topoisomerase [Rikenellaceae bacterium]
MQENLVIVESPAKAKTIEKFLGDDYIVKSSYGHIRDLAKKGLGIDIDNGFNPSYEVSSDKKKIITELTSLAKKAKTVWLASDEDREGEAIAWHLTEVLNLPVENTKRIVFHEITKDAIIKAIEAPRRVNMDLVNAQQARRILDRLVGFELSPVLWKKVKPSLSAGRVQSVTVRLLVEREREIIDFTSKEYFRVVAQMYIDGDKKQIVFKAELNKRFDTEAEAQSFLEACQEASFTVSKHEKKPMRRSPAAPFTTSTLQQEAGKKLGMSVSQTMSVAQTLYENGFITYMRTDSVNLSAQAIQAAKETIIAEFGEQYSEPRNFKTKSKGAQEAHEAIRPSYLAQQKIKGTPSEQKLYDLIWKRTIASQMAPAQIEKTSATISISNSPHTFNASGEVILFDGFLILDIAPIEEDIEQSQEGILPSMKVGDNVLFNNITSMQRFTQSPARYSESSLVKRLEELGIGRPSTYAPTITTIINRGYVIKQNKEGVKREYTQITLEKGKITKKTLSETTGKEKGKLSPTDIGMVVNDYLETRFKTIMDYNFTADAEKEFDEIAEGKKQWIEMLGGFYKGFHEQVNSALETVHASTNQLRILGVDPKTGKQVAARIGRYGPMVQIGGTDAEPEDDKPVYAGMKKGQLIASITLEQALELFSMPRNLGAYQEKDVVIGIGRFGPYARHDGKFTSIPKTDDPYSITLERAVELIEEKKKKDIIMQTPIKTFEEEPELQVLNGRYGPYIAYQGANYRIPKGTEPESLSLEQCKEIIAAAPAKVSKAKAKPAAKETKAKTTKAKATKAKKK